MGLYHSSSPTSASYCRSSKNNIVENAPTYADAARCDGQVNDAEMNFRPDTRIEADHVIEVSEETLDAVNIADDDHLRKGDEEVRPAGGVVVE